MGQPHRTLIVVCLLLSACAPSGPRSRFGDLPDTGQPALHAVTDAELRELMDQMDSLMFDRFTTQPDIDRERRNYGLRMAKAADGLAATVDAILARLPALGLSASEQTTFRALAGKLRDQALSLGAQARHNEFDAVPATLDRISSTCSSCHALFRKLGG